jgi:hypothetical protein
MDTVELGREVYEVSQRLADSGDNIIAEMLWVKGDKSAM